MKNARILRAVSIDIDGYPKSPRKGDSPDLRGTHAQLISDSLIF